MNDTYALTRDAAPATDWVRLIKAEYLEIPGLCLTPSQVRRLWNLDSLTAESLIAELTDIQFLRRTTRGTYVLADLAR
jgi:hypothetical protein